MWNKPPLFITEHTYKSFMTFDSFWILKSLFCWTQTGIWTKSSSSDIRVWVQLNHSQSRVHQNEDSSPRPASPGESLHCASPTCLSGISGLHDGNLGICCHTDGSTVAMTTCCTSCFIFDELSGTLQLFLWWKYKIRRESAFMYSVSARVSVSL